MLTKKDKLYQIIADGITITRPATYEEMLEYSGYNNMKAMMTDLTHMKKQGLITREGKYGPHRGTWSVILQETEPDNRDSSYLRRIRSQEVAKRLKKEGAIEERSKKTVETIHRRYGKDHYKRMSQKKYSNRSHKIEVKEG